MWFSRVVSTTTQPTLVFTAKLLVVWSLRKVAYEIQKLDNNIKVFWECSKSAGTLS